MRDTLLTDPSKTRTRRIELREIDATRYIPDAWPLLEDHREELATNKALMVLKPDLPVYIQLEDNGALLSIGAFDGDTIVGYSVNIISRNLHYADVLMCQNDVLYLDPHYRTGPNGLRLIRETERLAKERGCNLVLWHAKPGTNLLHMLPKLGYGTQDVVFSKGL
jgi:GNAT superfamily N-acetyltransferase